MTCYSTELERTKYVKGYGFLSLARNVSNKYGKELILLQKGLDAVKTVSKQVVHRK